MITSGIIEAVEESEWVSPMVVQDKKAKGEIRICVDLRKLNDASVHDPFPHHLQMRCLIMWEDKKCTLSQMDSQDTIRLKFIKKIGIRQLLQQNGAPFRV